MNREQAMRQLRQAGMFFLLAVPGMAMFLISSLMLFAAVYDPRANALSPLVSVPLGVVGLLLALVGTGNWRRWRYLYVLASVPISLLVFLLLDSRSGKLFPCVVITIVAFTVNHCVKKSYSDQTERNRHQHGAQISSGGAPGAPPTESPP